MFNSVEEVAKTSDVALYDLVRNRSYRAGLSDILSLEVLKKREAAEKTISEINTIAEDIAYAIRDRVQNSLDEEEESSDMDEFMSAIAYDLGLRYNWEYEHRPDSFWEESTC